jgi:hypothetical protein
MRQGAPGVNCSPGMMRDESAACLGLFVLAGSPADFGTLIAEETEKWARVVRAVNIKAE